MQEDVLTMLEAEAEKEVEQRAEEPEEEEQLEAGKAVVVEGSHNPQLNGRQGILCSYASKQERWMVDLPATAGAPQQRVAVRADTLRLLDSKSAEVSAPHAPAVQEDTHVFQEIPASHLPKKMNTEAEIDRLRAKALHHGHEANDLASDTLETVERQREQTRQDNARLHNVNAKLDVADGHLDDMDRPMFKIFGKGHDTENKESHVATEDDTEIVIQMFKNIWTRWHQYTLHFSHSSMKRVNEDHELKNEVVYHDILAITVQKKGNEVVLRVSEPQADEHYGSSWTCWTEDVEHLTKELVNRAKRAGAHVKVSFEEGATRFDYEPVCAVVLDYPTPVKPYEHMEGLDKANAGDMDFYGAMQDDLDMLLAKNRVIGHSLTQHTEELHHQQNLMETTNTRTSDLNDRIDGVDSKLGGTPTKDAAQEVKSALAKEVATAALL